MKHHHGQSLVFCTNFIYITSEELSIKNLIKSGRTTSNYFCISYMFFFQQCSGFKFLDLMFNSLSSSILSCLTNLPLKISWELQMWHLDNRPHLLWLFDINNLNLRAITSTSLEFPHYLLLLRNKFGSDFVIYF